MKLSNVLKVSAVLWAIWGVFHLFIGVASAVLFIKGHPVGQFEAFPEVMNITMFNMQSPFAPIATLVQHSYNLAWAGLIVTIGSIYVWKQNKTAIFLSALIGGLFDLGYFVFVDLGGYASFPGPQMTYICASAIVLSFYAYFKSDKLANI